METLLLTCFEDPLKSFATILAKQKQVYSMGFYLIRCAIYTQIKYITSIEIKMKRNLNIHFYSKEQSIKATYKFLI